MAGGPKVAILGAGSVGCFIGGAWSAAGLDVTFIGRPKLSSDIDEHGLTLSDYNGWQAHLAPGDTIVESKSLKLFLGSFRNHCGFHEDVTVGIGQRLTEEMKPRWLRIGGYWYPRGGIPIDVFWQSGAPPEGLWLPDQGVAAYRGRG